MPQLGELLESYRPAIDDLATDPWQELRTALASDPDLQRRAKAIQRQDEMLRAAMHDVPVPAGLEEQLLLSLQAGQSGDVVSASPEPKQATVALPQPKRADRRIWLAVAGGVLAITAIAVGLWPGGSRPQEQLSPGELTRHLQEWLSDPALQDGAAWQQVARGVIPEEIADDLPSAVAVRRRSDILRTDLGPAVVYELARGGSMARLYVVDTNRDCFVATSPYSPLPGVSGSRVAAAWQRGNLLYVLVVNPREADLRDFARIRETA